MTDETLLVTALSVASTGSAGLSVSATAAGPLPRAQGSMVLACNALVLPALAWLLQDTVGLGLAGIALVMAAAAPGGSTGPLMSVLAGGDPATAARLFASATLVGMTGSLAATLSIDGDFTKLVAALGFVVVASVCPLALGVVLRAQRPSWARRLARPLTVISVVLLVATVLLFCVRHGADVTGTELGWISVVVVASFTPALLVRGRQRRLAVAQVSATRNLTLALLVLTALDVEPRATGALFGYGLVMYVATAAVALVARWTAPKECPA